MRNAELLCALSGLERRMIEGHVPSGHTAYTLADDDARLVRVVVPDDIADLGFVAGSDLPDEFPVGSWVRLIAPDGWERASRRPLRTIVVRVTAPAAAIHVPATAGRHAA